jgi:septal ring factor EnvC (AmiA/AmiB activator)
MDDQQMTQVVGFVEKLATWVKSQGYLQKERAGTRGWLVGLGIATVAFLGIAALLWRQRMAGAALAKLQHERDVAAQEAKRAEAQVHIRENERKIEELQAKANDARARIVDIDAKITQVDHQRSKAIDDIDDLKNWRDVDRYLGGGPPTPTGSAT